MRPTTNPPAAPRPSRFGTSPAPALPAVPGATTPLPADHHLWRNGRLWWIAITLYDATGRRRRVRESLGTKDVREARRQRDQFLDRVRREGRFTIAAPPWRGPRAPHASHPPSAGVAA